MTVTRKIRVSDLLTEFLTNAFIFLRALQTAGAIAAGSLQAIADHLNHFLIIVQSNSHFITSSPLYYRNNTPIVKKSPDAFVN